MKKKTSWLATAVALGLPLAAVAQTNPADPAAPAQALGYQSAFSDYKPWQDIKPADWRAVNDTVRDAAAKASHGGQGSAPAAAPAAVAAAPQATPRPAAPTPAPAAAPQAPAGHQGHGDHK